MDFDEDIISPRAGIPDLLKGSNNIAKELLKQRIKDSPNLKRKARYIHSLAKVKKRLSQENLLIQ